MAKSFAKLILKNFSTNTLLVTEAVNRLIFDIAYAEYALQSFNPAGETQESIDEAKQLLQKLKNLQESHK
ncbi:MAG: hypothetical protein ACMG55_16970 [Microcoleus sp.]